MRKVIGILLAGAMIGGYIWYMFLDKEPANQRSVEKRITTSPETAADTPPPSSPVPKEPEPAEKLKTDKINVSMPPMKVIKGVSGIKAPDQANRIAARFHWLFYLDGPTISGEARQQEIKIIVEPTVFEQIRGMLVQQRKQTQKWRPILVSATEKESDGYWFNTVCLVNGEQTTLYFKVGKEENGWKVREFLTR